MKLSVVIPVYNERRDISELVRRVQAVAVDKELVLVDDASTDGTTDVIRTQILPQYRNIQYFRHEKNLGKGSAIRTALAAVTGDVIIIQDSDLEYSPQDYLPILEKFKHPSVDVVYGTRFQKVNRYLFVWHWFCNRFFKTHYEIRYLHHFLGIQALNLLANYLYSANITDEATCYKAFRKKVLDKISLRCTGFEFCPEVTAKVRKAGFVIHEVPISYHPRSRAEGKKLNWRHGFEAIFTLIRYRFSD